MESRNEITALIYTVYIVIIEANLGARTKCLHILLTRMEIDTQSPTGLF